MLTLSEELIYVSDVPGTCTINTILAAMQNQGIESAFVLGLAEQAGLLYLAENFHSFDFPHMIRSTTKGNFYAETCYSMTPSSAAIYPLGKISHMVYVGKDFIYDDGSRLPLENPGFLESYKIFKA